ncbi:MAG TPA: glycosyltransferase family 1 protein [Puia sp.]|nr:glycosyltransferase family 1 protein [Puia sp.]
MKIIAIDAATIIPGKGGAGGGIWTYTQNILKILDQLAETESGLRIKVFVNSNFDLELKNIDIIRVNINTASLSKRLWYIHFMLPSLCKKNHVDVLHKLATEVPLYYKGDMIVTLHDFMNDYYYEKGYYKKNIFQLLKLYYFKQIEKIAVKKSKLILLNSIAIKDELIKRYGNKNVIVTGSGNSVDEILFVPRKKKPICFYCVAGYYPHKGQVSVIKLVELLVSKYNLDITLYFRGNPGYPQYFNSILKRIEQSPCREKISIENFAAHETITDIYSKASTMVLLSEYEGFGLPVIEAQALGLPVICSDIPVFREVSGGYAFFVNVNDMENAAGAVYDYLHNEEAMNSNIKNGLENVKRFSCKKIVAQILLAYKST